MNKFQPIFLNLFRTYTRYQTWLSNFKIKCKSILIRSKIIEKDINNNIVISKYKQYIWIMDGPLFKLKRIL